MKGQRSGLVLTLTSRRRLRFRGLRLQHRCTPTCRVAPRAGQACSERNQVGTREAVATRPGVGLICRTDGIPLAEQTPHSHSDLHIHKTCGNPLNKTPLHTELREPALDTVIITGFCADGHSGTAVTCGIVPATRIWREPPTLSRSFRHQCEVENVLPPQRGVAWATEAAPTLGLGR